MSEATVSKMEIVRSEGSRKVRREVDFFNLDAIIAVGYRVNSFQATEEFQHILTTFPLVDESVKSQTHNTYRELVKLGKFA